MNEFLLKPAPKLCRSERVWDFPTSILQSKISRCIYVCIACNNYEASQCAFQIWKSFCSQDRPFLSSTWSGRLFFFLENFRVCNRRKQGELVPTCNFWIRFFKSDFKNACGLCPNPIFSTKLRWPCILSSKGIMTHKGAGTVQPSLFLPKFSSPFLATRRKWRIFKSFCWHSSIFVVVYSNNLI